MFHNKTVIPFFFLLTAAALISCGSQPEPIQESEPAESEIVINISGSEDSEKSSAPTETAASDSSVPSGSSSRTSAPQSDPALPSQADDKKARFGQYCIPEQTFEVELSEYNGKVSFVPFAPSDTQDFHMQIIQDHQILADISGYVPVELAGEPFQSLDAVSFYDVNYDGCTDLVLIETYGATSFTAVYYGFDPAGEDYEQYFIFQEQLSANLTRQSSPLSVASIRSLLSDGKRNGEFASWQEAYKAVGKLQELADTSQNQYSLIYVDEDDIPELAAGVNGYYVSLYTYSDGRVYTLMDRWPYGAMGNAGYEYSPRKNSLRNDNSDYAGAILYTTYMTITDSHSIHTAAEIVVYNFDDVNGNGILDENETGSFGLYGVTRINGVEASPEECAAYDAGDYEIIQGTMTYDALLSACSQG